MEIYLAGEPDIAHEISETAPKRLLLPCSEGLNRRAGGVDN
jgi:hypothetical protein